MMLRVSSKLHISKTKYLLSNSQHRKLQTHEVLNHQHDQVYSSFQQTGKTEAAEMV